jgi:stalled ribosome alternative rescue factor ArfA
MRVERQRKGKGSFRRDKRVAEPEGERGAEK